jgi:hypothetical protein
MRWLRRAGWALVWLVAALLGALGLWALLPAAKAPIAAADAIASLERVSLGGVPQTILVRGHDRATLLGPARAPLRGDALGPARRRRLARGHRLRERDARPHRGRRDRALRAARAALRRRPDLLARPLVGQRGRRARCAAAARPVRGLRRARAGGERTPQRGALLPLRGGGGGAPRGRAGTGGAGPHPSALRDTTRARRAARLARDLSGQRLRHRPRARGAARGALRPRVHARDATPLRRLLPAFTRAALGGARRLRRAALSPGRTRPCP